MYKVTIEAVGQECGIALPKELLDELGLKPGDEVDIVETNRGLELRPRDPTHMKAVRSAKAFMDRYQKAMRDLSG